MNNKKNRGYGRPGGKLFLILFTVLFFMVLGIIFLSYSFNTKTLTQRDLYKGESLALNDNDSLSFKFEKEKHKINITLFGSNSVDVTIYSEPLTKHIKINESAFFDLNNDSKNDLRVWLKEIVNYNAMIEFKRVDEGFCVPEWDCGKWGSCIDGLRKRTCEDVSRCGRPEEAPELERFCSDLVDDEEIPEEGPVEERPEVNVSNQSNESNVSQEDNNTGLVFNNPESDFFIGNGEVTCSGNGGEVCSGSEKCQGDWINSSDSLRCCFGSCYSLQYNFDESGNSVTCDKSITSFRLAVFNCTSFVMNCVEIVLIPELGIVQRFESVFNIQGYYPGDNCLFGYGYGDVFLNYTSDKYDELFSEGNTVGQINYELDILRGDFENKFQDKSMVCKYPQNEFLEFARAWEDGNLEWDRSVLGKYECTGDLAGL
jgi:hypothetical protein